LLYTLSLHDALPISSTESQRRHRKRDDKGKSAAKYERHKAKQMLRRLK
jgi:hypothetical protein